MAFENIQKKKSPQYGSNPKISQINPVSINDTIIQMCSFCHKDIETISHMFTECPYAKKFWSDIEKWYGNETTSKIQLHQQTILFGFHPKHLLENLITLVAKAHIYSSRIQSQTPHIDLCILRLRSIYTIESYIAQTTDKYNTFKTKWQG